MAVETPPRPPRPQASSPTSAQASAQARSEGGSARPSGAAAAKSGSGLWPLLGAIALLAVTGLGIASWRAQRLDAHFVTAEKMLRDYELGKDPSQLNYDDPTYPQALGELGLVSAASVSAEPARQLANEINVKILGFRQRIKLRQAERAAAVRAEDERTAALASAQAASTGVDVWAADRVTLQGATECKEERAHYEASEKRHQH